MSGHASLPSRPVEPLSPNRSPEREEGLSRQRHADPPPHLDHPDRGGHEGDRWEGRRDYDDRWSEDYDRKRRRSPSPNYALQRPRRRSPSPGRYHMPDPASLDHLLTFKQFAEWFRASHPQTARDDDEDLRRIRSDVDSGVLPKSVLIEKHGMAKRYERYKKEYQSRQLFTIYLTHRDQAWFQERYAAGAEASALRRRVNRQGRVPTAETYIAELRDGKHDAANFDQTDDKFPHREEREAMDRALGEEPYDPLRTEVPPRPGQVFVKTVPPTTRRVDLEGVFAKHKGFQWLALSDPSAKRGFHRVGWAQYEDGVNVEEAVSTIDGSKVDNFTFHMGVNASSIVGRIKIAPPLTGTLARMERDAEQARALARKLEDELLEEEPAAEDEADKPAETEDKSPKATARGLHERGSDAVADVITRLLAQENLDGEELDDDQKSRKAKITLDQYISYLRLGLNCCYYCVATTAFPEELQRKCVGHLRAPLEESAPADEGMEDERGEEKADTRDDGEQGAHEARDGDERDRRDGGNHQGRRYNYPSKSNDEKWAENLDLKIHGVVDADFDAVELGGRDMDDETKRFTAPFIKQEELDKYRCKQCLKLFRAPEFVIKHVVSKHSELVKDKLDEMTMFNTFVLDPNHLVPSSNTPAAVDDQLPIKPGSLPAFNPALANPALFNPNAANQPGFNMAMQQQMMMMMQMQMMMQGGMGSMPGGVSGTPTKGQSRDFDPTELPPAPPGGEDPRARRGPVSYHDLDEPGGGADGGLPY